MTHYPFEIMMEDEESFFSLLLQKSAIFTAGLTTLINQLVRNRTIKVIRYLKGRESRSRDHFIHP